MSHYVSFYDFKSAGALASHLGVSVVFCRLNDTKNYDVASGLRCTARLFSWKYVSRFKRAKNTHRDTYVHGHRLVGSLSSVYFCLRKTKRQIEIWKPIFVQYSCYCTSRCAIARHAAGSFIISPTNRHDRAKCITDLGFCFRQISVAQVR